MKKYLFVIMIFLFTIKVNAIENITINNETLSPLFDNNIKKYNYYTDKDIIKIQINSDKNEIVKGYGVFELKNKENVFNIYSSKYGDYKIYVFKNYEKSTEKKLISLFIEGYDINFNPNVYEYDISISNEDYLDINYELSNENMNVSITGNGNFNNTKNKIIINVEDKTYTINVYKSIQTFKEKSNQNKESNNLKYNPYLLVILLIIIAVIIIMLYFKLLFI